METQEKKDISFALEMAGVEYQWPGKQNFSISIERFAIEPGERVLLLGESGSGKSTLLSLICGIILPDSGTISIGQTSLNDLSPTERDRFRAENIGVIFQMFNLLPNVTPLDNVLLPLHFAPARKARLDEPAREAALSIMQKLGLPLDAMIGSPSSRLSVGQQQRVAVARALIGQPSLIIADEPTSALDEKSQSSFMQLLFEQLATAGSTLLMVSHDASLASRFSRTVSMSDIAETRQMVLA
ncbi:MAG: ABC transporter ATP-binding protein [Pseudomonadota bacterium]